MTKHAKLSPSGASRWLSCTMAPALEENFENTTSSYAEEGTLAHELCELETAFLLGQIQKRTRTIKHKKIAANEYYNEEMQEHADDYAMFIKELFLEEQAKCEDAICALEVRLDLTAYVPESFGTSDCIIVSDGTLFVIDFKYGKGHRVDAENNPQMKLYALGAYEKYSALYDIRNVEMIIVQPRLDGVSRASLVIEDLLEWGEFIKPIASDAYNGTGEFKPSEEACKFCRAKADCRARAEMYIGLFEANDAENLNLLSTTELGDLLERAKGIDGWLSDLKSRAVELLADGEPVAGWKLVEGRSNRCYTDESAVVERLRASGFSDDQMYTKKLITITGVEKAIGKKEAAEVLEGLIVKPPGSPTLAPESDRRPAIMRKEDIVDAFDEE